MVVSDFLVESGFAWSLLAKRPAWRLFVLRKQDLVVTLLGLVFVWMFPLLFRLECLFRWCLGGFVFSNGFLMIFLVICLQLVLMEVSSREASLCV